MWLLDLFADDNEAVATSGLNVSAVAVQALRLLTSRDFKCPEVLEKPVPREIRGLVERA